MTTLTQKRLEGLERDGWITRVGDGYQITDGGKNALDALVMVGLLKPGYGMTDLFREAVEGRGLITTLRKIKERNEVAEGPERNAILKIANEPVRKEN